MNQIPALVTPRGRQVDAARAQVVALVVDSDQVRRRIRPSVLAKFAVVDREVVPVREATDPAPRVSLLNLLTDLHVCFLCE
jgi:hypothetical protein